MTMDIIDFVAPVGSVGRGYDSYGTLCRLIVDRVDPVLCKELGMERANNDLYLGNMEAVQLLRDIDMRESNSLGGLPDSTQFVIRVFSGRADESQVIKKLAESFPDYSVRDFRKK